MGASPGRARLTVVTQNPGTNSRHPADSPRPKRHKPNETLSAAHKRCRVIAQVEQMTRNE
eukprot:gene2659-biopygen3541